MQGYLCDLPSEWRTQIAKVICDYINPDVPLNCDDVRSCETVTTLSAFTITGTQVCITYKDENNIEHNRCFDAADVSLDLDPKCLMSQSAWDLLSWKEKIQAIIDKACVC